MAQQEFSSVSLDKLPGVLLKAAQELEEASKAHVLLASLWHSDPKDLPEITLLLKRADASCSQTFAPAEYKSAAKALLPLFEEAAKRAHSDLINAWSKCAEIANIGLQVITQARN